MDPTRFGDIICILSSARRVLLTTNQYLCERWNAARAFATYLDAHPQLYQNQNVIELGAGGGLPGIVAALNGANTVCLQDFIPIDFIADSLRLCWLTTQIPLYWRTLNITLTATYHLMQGRMYLSRYLSPTFPPCRVHDKFRDIFGGGQLLTCWKHCQAGKWGSMWYWCRTWFLTTQRFVFEVLVMVVTHFQLPAARCTAEELSSTQCNGSWLLATNFARFLHTPSPTSCYKRYGLFWESKNSLDCKEGCSKGLSGTQPTLLLDRLYLRFTANVCEWPRGYGNPECSSWVETVKGIYWLPHISGVHIHWNFATFREIRPDRSKRVCTVASEPFGC